MAVRRGGGGELGKTPDPSLFCVTPGGLTGDRNNGNRTTVTRNVTKEKQPICEAEQMRKIVRYRKKTPYLNQSGTQTAVDVEVVESRRRHN